MVVTMILPHNLIHLGFFFLYKWRVYGGSTWFDMKLLFFFNSLFSFSFFLGLHVDHAKIHTSLSIFFFDSITLLLFEIVLFTLIVFYWILFLISPPWSFDFFNLFSNLVLILLISICFVLNYFLDWFVFFFSIPPLGIYFYLIFMSNLVLILLIPIF
jgi:hypothetical protein